MTLVRRTSLPGTIFTLVALLATAAHAQQPAPSPPPPDLKSLSLEQLGNIEVTTQSKEPTQVWNTAAAIYVLTGEDIRRSGVTNIPDALRLVPGVNVSRVNGARNWAVSIRGFADQFSKYIQVLIDGRSVYTPLFGGVYWNIDNVVIEDVDRIEIIRGPGGTIWGADAVNGIINIITKSAADTHGLLAAAGGGNADQSTDTLRYGSHHRGLDYRIFAFGFIRSAEYHPAGQQQYDWSRLGQAGFRADWQNEANEVTLQGDFYLSKLGDAQSNSTYTPQSATISYAPTNADGGNLLGRWRRNFNNGGDFYFQAFWSHDRRLGSNFGEVRDKVDIDFLHRTPALKFSQFTYGAGIRLSPSHTTSTVPTSFFDPDHKTDEIYSAFLQEDLHIIPHKLSLTLGSKFEYNNYTHYEIQPNGRLLFTPTPTQSLWFAISGAVRTPDRVDDDIHVDVFAIPGIYARVIGNHDLTAEYLTAYEGGYRALLHPRLYLDLAAFHNHYRGIIAQGAPQIAPAPTPPFQPGNLLFTFQFVNGIGGNTDGFELAPDYNVNSWWRLKAAYSYLHVDLHDKPGFTDTVTLTKLHGSSPNSQVALRSFINLPHKFEFDQAFRFVGGLPAQKVQAYYTADARIGYHPNSHLDLSVTGENLMQPHHTEFGIDPPPNIAIKRSVYAKIVWTR